MTARFVVLCALGCAAYPAAAATITVKSSRDNTLYESSAGNLSNGAGQHLFAGTTASGSIRRGLLYFDIAASLPAGATITSAALTLHMSRTIGGTETVSLHRATTSWGEAGSQGTGEEGGGFPAQPGDATWLHTSYSSQFWNNPGGDYSASASADLSVGGIGAYTWSGAGLRADVQAWYTTPADNYGWLIRGDESTIKTAKRFDTREIFDPNFAPALVIEYIPEPASAALLVPAVLAVWRRRGVENRR